MQLSWHPPTLGPRSRGHQPSVLETAQHGFFGHSRLSYKPSKDQPGLGTKSRPHIPLLRKKRG